VPGTIEATSVVIERSSLCGIQIAGGTAVLRSTVSRSNPIGLCVQGDAPPPLGGVELVDNATDVQATSFSTPPTGHHRPRKVESG